MRQQRYKGTNYLQTDKNCQINLHIFVLFSTFVADW